MRRAAVTIKWYLHRDFVRQRARIMSTVASQGNVVDGVQMEPPAPHPITLPPALTLPVPTSPVPISSAKKASVAQMLYRRPLPGSCIAFASDEGKLIFREALGTGHMNCYFRLASQFRTQDEPAYCGLSTLIMVLNALEIDPGRIWKGPWKWYHEDMLDCCVSREIMRKEGITFDEFICLADCNSLDTQAARVDALSKEDNFRHMVMDVTQREDLFLVLAYSRQTLNQTGDGHFAPVSGYHPGRDLVLILDTARFKYPPHWVPLPLLFEAMQKLDKSTGLPRGYILLRQAQDFKTLLLFKTSEQFSVNASPQSLQSFEAFISAWTHHLQEPLRTSASSTDPLSSTTPSVSAVVQQSLQGLVEVAGSLKHKPAVLRTQEHVSCTHACNLQCIVSQLIMELRGLELHQLVCDQVNTMSREDVSHLEGLFGMWPCVATPKTMTATITTMTTTIGNCYPKPAMTEPTTGKTSAAATGDRQCCDMHQFLCLCDFLVAFLLSWPYTGILTPLTPASVGCGLDRLAKTQLLHDGSKSSVLKDEMTTLKRQLKKLTGFHHSPVGSPRSPLLGDKKCCSSSENPCKKPAPASKDTCCSQKK